MRLEDGGRLHFLLEDEGRHGQSLTINHRQAGDGGHAELEVDRHQEAQPHPGGHQALLVRCVGIASGSLAT